MTIELGAVIALAALVIGGFYYQGARFDRLIEGRSRRIDDLKESQSRRIDDLAQRMARIQGILEGWLSPPPVLSGTSEAHRTARGLGVGAASLSILAGAWIFFGRSRAAAANAYSRRTRPASRNCRRSARRSSPLRRKAASSASRTAK